MDTNEIQLSNALRSIQTLLEIKSNTEKILVTQKQVAFDAILGMYATFLQGNTEGVKFLSKKPISPYEEHDSLLCVIASTIVSIPLLKPDDEIPGINIASLMSGNFDLNSFLEEHNRFSVKYFGIFLQEKDLLLYVKLKNKKVKITKDHNK